MPPKKKVVEKNIDPEFVSLLMKQFFDLQMADIDRKTKKNRDMQNEFKQGKIDVENSLAEFEKEQGVIISALKQAVEVKESERIERRSKVYWLMDELKVRAERYKSVIKEKEIEYKTMVDTLSQKIAELEVTLGILEDFKQNKDLYSNNLAEEEAAMHEREREHQRTLFEIARKLEVAKVRLKKELESRLLQLSVKFQETTENKLGSTTHRLIQENIAIENELKIMRDNLDNYQTEYDKAARNINYSKSREKMRDEEKTKFLGKTVVQLEIIKQLIKDKKELFLQGEKIRKLESDNFELEKKLHVLEAKLNHKKADLDEIEQLLSEKIEEATEMGENSLALKKCFRKLQVIVRSCWKLAEQAAAVSLIPFGGTEEEKRMTYDSKLNLFRSRRDSSFAKKGRMLKYLLDIIAKAQLSEEEKNLLKSSTESINLKGIRFHEVYGVVGKVEEEAPPEKEEVEPPALEKEESLKSSESDISLPRLVSEVVVAKKVEGEEEEEEGEEEFEAEAEGEEEAETEAEAEISTPATQEGMQEGSPEGVVEQPVEGSEAPESQPTEVPPSTEDG